MAAAIPKSTTVLVIGGGPGGSYAAATLAREGVDVVLLEADKFPRYHVGESQLASMRHFLRFIDLEEEFDAFGFQKKPGAGFKLNRHKREGYTDFISKDPGNYSWNTVRSQADELMLRHASKVGAKVFEETKVTSVEFSTPSPSPADILSSKVWPISATYKRKDTGDEGTIEFKHVIDASGRVGVLGSKYLKNRIINEGLKNVAWWGYWPNTAENGRVTGKYMPGTPRENSPFFEALDDESGWAWFIPLHDGTTSVGVVQNQEKANAKKKELGKGLQESYLKELGRAKQIMELIGPDAALTKKADVPIVSSASDYSYSSAESGYAGRGWRLVGDAGAFIDPYFSSGVHLAISGGLAAAATICAVLKNECSEEEAAAWYRGRTEGSYGRFLLVVLSAYQQIRNQAKDVLATSTEDNFDRAFDVFRPIIQGHTETRNPANAVTAKDLSPEAIEFLAEHAFEPSTPEDRKRIASTNGPTTEEEKAIVNSIRVRELMRTEDIVHLGHFLKDTWGGRALRMERGSLGLQIVDVAA